MTLAIQFARQRKATTELGAALRATRGSRALAQKRVAREPRGGERRGSRAGAQKPVLRRNRSGVRSSAAGIARGVRTRAPNFSPAAEDRVARGPTSSSSRPARPRFLERRLLTPTMAASAAVVPLPALSSPPSLSSLLPSRPRALRINTLLSLSAKPRAWATAAAGSDSSNFGNQTSLMPPFSFTLDEGSSRSKRPYRWQRVLLKVSGEALAGDRTENIDPKITMAIAREVASVTKLGVEVAIVVGGGNIFRGASWAGCSGLDRSSADYIGMLATVMNAIFLQATMESIGIPTRVQTAFRMSEVAEPYIRRRAVRHLEKGRVVIFAAGTGNPFFTTDTAAALRCAEINAEVVLKATNVDGVYDADPRYNPNTRLLETVSYHEVITRDLSVMDMTAITLCQENNIPVVVFNLQKPGNIAKAIVGENVGTFIGCTKNQEQNGNALGEERRLVNEV